MSGRCVLNVWQGPQQVVTAQLVNTLGGHSLISGAELAVVQSYFNAPGIIPARAGSLCAGGSPSAHLGTGDAKVIGFQHDSLILQERAPLQPQWALFFWKSALAKGLSALGGC